MFVSGHLKCARARSAGNPNKQHFTVVSIGSLFSLVEWFPSTLETFGLSSVENEQ